MLLLVADYDDKCLLRPYCVPAQYGKYFMWIVSLNPHSNLEKGGNIVIPILIPSEEKFKA